ncbi:hypothetical protein [Caproiciproducens sp. CPB-2]|uniref:hypothetical protein n=1 Tax=Caproiciproducens sp. CPB-2 TaxID=3030017 RepID=UPI0023DB11F5|nr:hypothetical protein [Caproiciproducens sp. CPB-2]MDF1496318.1 hypothetical protein [Caproiciproducens sp. CPB-2]
MAKLLIGNNENYEIVTDMPVYICPQYGEIDSVNAHDCEHCEEKQQGRCNGVIKFHADVGVENYPDDYFLYAVFNQKPNKQLKSSIYYINARSQLLKTMAELKSEVDNWRNYCAEQYEYFDELTSYAKEFMERVQKDFAIPYQKDILPLKLHSECYDTKQYCADNKDGITQGNFCPYLKQSEINIYECNPSYQKRNEQSIRHEIIHYILWTQNLKENDDTAVFHLMTEYYDANPYKPMTRGEKTLYNRYKRLCVLLDIFQKYYPDICQEATGEDNLNSIKKTLMLALGCKDRHKEQRKNFNGLYRTYMKYEHLLKSKCAAA